MALVAKSSAILHAAKLEQDLEVPIGGGNKLTIGIARDWVIWDEKKKLKDVLDDRTFRDKYSTVG